MRRTPCAERRRRSARARRSRAFSAFRRSRNAGRAHGARGSRKWGTARGGGLHYPDSGGVLPGLRGKVCKQKPPIVRITHSAAFNFFAFFVLRLTLQSACSAIGCARGGSSLGTAGSGRCRGVRRTPCAERRRRSARARRSRAFSAFRRSRNAGRAHGARGSRKWGTARGRGLHYPDSGGVLPGLRGKVCKQKPPIVQITHSAAFNFFAFFALRLTPQSACSAIGCARGAELREAQFSVCGGKPPPYSAACGG